MNKLTKKAQARWDELKASLQSEHDDETARLEAFNESLDERWGEVQSAIETFNEATAEEHAELVSERESYIEAITDTQSFVEETRNEMEGYADDKSERWNEGERGEAYRSDFLGEWENVDLTEPDLGEVSEVSLDQPDPLDLPDNPTDDLESLPVEFEF